MEAEARERDVRNAAIEALLATHAFEGVYPYVMPEDRGRRAGDLRAAVVAPVNGSNTLEYDDVSGGNPLCRMSFNVIVMCRDDDAQVRDDAADRLLSVARNAINGMSLAGLTFPFMTIVRNHQWIAPTPPERQIRLLVEAAYEVPGWTSFNTDE